MTTLEFFRRDEPAERLIHRGPFAIHAVAIDTSSLVSDVYHKVRRGSTYLSDISRLGSFRLFAPTPFYYEVYRRLPKPAHTPEEYVRARAIWESEYLPLIRWCRTGVPEWVDARVDLVTHEADRVLAMLATQIAPCYVWSDNHRHLGSVGVLGDPNWREMARWGQSVANLDIAVLGAAIPTSAAAEGLKSSASYLYQRPILGLIILGAILAAVGFGAYKLSRDEAGPARHRLAEGLGALAEQVGPIVRKAQEEIAALRERELVASPTAGLNEQIAHTLSIAPRPLLMREIRSALAYAAGREISVQAISDVLWSNDLFHRFDDARWQVGFTAAPLIDG